jgi:homoserine dehydrogenase
MSVALATDVDIIVELMGGIDLSRSVVEAALRAGKHVVTANKALLAHDGAELFAIANEVDRELAFEASVGGSIPVIRSMKEGYVADNVLGIYGIVNGTCNYILSTMTDEGADFAATLKDAQQLGYAEADPTFDVEGIDSAHKIAILAMLAYGVRFDYKAIPTEGITKISKADIDFARRFGYKIKLTAIARLQKGKLDIRVHPSMLPDSSQLAQVHGVFNAIYLEGDNVGASMLYGRGAGSLPTASAVISDIVAIARNGDKGRRAPDSGYILDEVRDIELLSSDDIESEYYLRLTARDEPGVLGQIATLLGAHKISIASMLQEGRSDGDVPLVFLTHTAREGDIRNAIAELEKMRCTSSSTFLRILQNLS